MEYVEMEHECFCLRFQRYLCQSHCYISVCGVKAKPFREFIFYNLQFIQHDQ